MIWKLLMERYALTAKEAQAIEYEANEWLCQSYDGIIPDKYNKLMARACLMCKPTTLNKAASLDQVCQVPIDISGQPVA